MDWADDVAYSVHDVEDGIHAGLIDLTALQDPDTSTAICQLVATTYLPGTDPADLAAALDRLVGSPAWPAGYSHYTGSLRDLAALKDLTSQLIGRFTAAAESATREAHPQAQLTRYAGSLEVPAEIRHEVGVLKGIANLFVMQRSGSKRSYDRQRAMIAELVAALSASAPREPRTALPPHLGARARRRRHGCAWSSTRWPASPTSRWSPGTSATAADSGGHAGGAGPARGPAPPGRAGGQRLSLPPPSRISDARPASSRATGTRNGEQDT